MSGTSKFITAQVGAKLVTIELGAVNPHGNRKFKADMFGAVGALINSTKEGYLLMVELQELEKKYWYWTCWGSTISQCTDQFFAELRYQNERLEAAQIDTAQPPALEKRVFFFLYMKERDGSNYYYNGQASDTDGLLSIDGFLVKPFMTKELAQFFADCCRVKKRETFWSIGQIELELNPCPPTRDEHELNNYEHTKADW